MYVNDAKEKILGGRIEIAGERARARARGKREAKQSSRDRSRRPMRHQAGDDVVVVSRSSHTESLRVPVPSPFRGLPVGRGDRPSRRTHPSVPFFLSSCAVKHELSQDCTLDTSKDRGGRRLQIWGRVSLARVQYVRGSLLGYADKFR